MRFAILRKAGPAAAGGPVSPLVSTPGVTVHESADLAPHAAAVRLAFSADGPQPHDDGTPSNDDASLANLSIVEADSREAAIDWLRSQAPHADTEFELRETGCPGGLPGVDPATAASRPRFLVLVKADADTEADRAPAAERLGRMAQRNDEAVRSGMLLAADGLKSTARGTRVKFRDGQPRVLDGPFAEAKELIAGFWLLQAESMDDVVDWVRRYPYAQDCPQVEIRPVVD